jgi:hypothetical protein
MIPVLFVISAGTVKPLQFDQFQRHEILLTILQSLLGFLLLMNLQLVMWEAAILFVFWAVQFFVPASREVMLWVYAGWCGIEVIKILLGRKAPAAWVGLKRTWARRFATAE